VSTDRKICLSIEQVAPRWEFCDAPGTVSIIGHCFGSQADRETAATAALQGKPELLSGLPGNYTTVVERSDEIRVSIDQSGVHPFYWRLSGNELHISDTSTHLGTEPNALYLAATILDCPIITTGQSAIQGVDKVEGGHVACFSKQRKPIIHDRRIVPDPSYTFKEAADELSETLPGAVALRMEPGKKETADCSGGRDSTLISILASEKSNNGFDALIQRTKDTIVGDLPYALAIAQNSSGMRLHEVVGGNEVLPFLNMESIGLTNEPDLGAVINARLRQRFTAAQQLGSEVHMTGDGGDLVLDAPFIALTGLSHASHSVLLREFCIERGSIKYKAPQELTRYIKEYASKPLAAECREWADYVCGPSPFVDRPFPYDSGWLPWPGTSLNLLRSRMRQRLGEQVMRLKDEALFSDISIAEFAAIGATRNNGTSFRHLQILGQTFGIDVHAPFIDKQVMGSCLRLPAHRRMIPGTFKPLLAAAFPEKRSSGLFERASKSAYIHELYRGLRIAIPQIRGLLKDSRLADLEVIEPKAVLEEVRRLDMSLQGSFPAICKIIGTELWVRQLAGE
jgi:asparagine synthase (glutamine-hydrolysing)